MSRWILVPVLLMACERSVAPTAPASPVLAVLVPLSGEAAGRGQAVVEAARAAADGRYEVLAVDDTGPAGVAALVARPEVSVALAHLSGAAVDRSAESWLAADLPVLTLAVGAEPRLPRAALNAEELGRCAAALAGGRRVAVVHDGTGPAMAMATTLQGQLGPRAHTLLALDPNVLASDVGRLRSGRYDEVLYAGASALGGDLVRAMRSQKLETPVLAVGGSAEDLFAAAGAAAGAARVVAPDRAPYFGDTLARLEARAGGSPSGLARDAYDAAAVLVAALDAVPRGEDGLPDRADVRAAIELVIGVGVGGPLAIVDGRPSPAQCTAYHRPAGALEVDTAAQIGTDGVPVLLEVRRRGE